MSGEAIIGLLLMLGALLYFTLKLWAYESYVDAVIAYRQQEIDDAEAIIAEREKTEARSTQPAPASPPAQRLVSDESA